jgi:hypothetical protein
VDPTASVLSPKSGSRVNEVGFGASLACVQQGQQAGEPLEPRKEYSAAMENKRSKWGLRGHELHYVCKEIECLLTLTFMIAGLKEAPTVCSFHRSSIYLTLISQVTFGSK